MKTYTVGTKVFCDFHFGGKPRGKVIEIVEPGDGKRMTTGKVRVQITETVGAYRNGEVLIVNTFEAVPVKQEFRKRGSFFRWINTDYCFA